MHNEVYILGTQLGLHSSWYHMNPLLTLLLCEDCQNWEWKLSANYTQCNGFASKNRTPSGERSVEGSKREMTINSIKREREKRVLGYTYITIKLQHIEVIHKVSSPLLYLAKPSSCDSP